MAQPISPACSNLSRYIGREYEKVNCWELVREFYLGEFLIELKKYYNGLTPDKYTTASLIQSNKGEFQKVEGEPKYGDLMSIKIHGLECHVGIFIGNGKFLHTLEGAGSVLESIERYRPRIVAYYRHKGINS